MLDKLIFCRKSIKIIYVPREKHLGDILFESDVNKKIFVRLWYEYVIVTNIYMD